MNKWLNQFLEKPDISDRFGFNMNMSGLSGRPQGLLKENLGNISEIGPDISDRFHSNGESSKKCVKFQEVRRLYERRRKEI